MVSQNAFAISGIGGPPVLVMLAMHEDQKRSAAASLTTTFCISKGVATSVMEKFRSVMEIGRMK
jgi:hypothetical protein